MARAKKGKIKSRGRRPRGDRRRAAATSLASQARLLTARDVMNPIVLSIRQDKTVRELAAFLTENEISGAPVVDGHGKLVGVVSLRDIVEKAGGGNEELAGGRRRLGSSEWGDKLTPNEAGQMHIENEGLLVREIMTPSVYTVAESIPVAQVAETMLRGHIHRLLVVRGSQAVGIISSLDLLKLLVS